MEYITVKNGIITGHYCGQSLPVGAVEVKDFIGFVGDRTEYYKSDWTRKTDVELVKEGIEPMKDGYKWNEGQTGFVEMSQTERIQAGLEELPQGQKIEGGEVVMMSDEEKLASGQITQAEYTEIRRGQILAELDAIDRKTIRPLRAILAGIGTDDDRERMAELERQAEELRAELDELTGGER